MPRFLPMAGLLAASTGLLAGCEEDTYVIDPFPVSMNFAHGIPEATGCIPDLQSCGPSDQLVLVLDSATPVSVVDTNAEQRTRRKTTIDLHAPGPDGGTVTRARFEGVAAVAGDIGESGYFVCRSDDTCAIDRGDEHTNVVEPHIVVGADVLSSFALRLDPARSLAFFFPYIAGDPDALARECSGNFPLGLSGGGTFLIDDAEVSFPATRLVMGACLNLDPNPTREQPEITRRPKGLGADANLLVATGLPFSVLSESAYRRARLALPAPDAASELENLPVVHLRLPGMPPSCCNDAQVARLGKLQWLGLSANQIDDLGACKEIATSRFLDLGGCVKEERDTLRVPGDDFTRVCPCVDQDTATDKIIDCGGAGATAEVGDIDVVVVPDDSPILQSLRTELRPESPDIDGLLGMNALRNFVTDLDYKNARMVLRCNQLGSEVCAVRPRMDRASADRLRETCLGQQFFTSTPRERELLDMGGGPVD